MPILEPLSYPLGPACIRIHLYKHAAAARYQNLIIVVEEHEAQGSTCPSPLAIR